MSDQQRIIIAIISPKKDKFDEVFGLLDALISGVKGLEPNCDLFQAHRETNPQTEAEEIFMIERFKNNDSIVFHQKNPAFHAFGEALNKSDLLIKPLYIKIVAPVKGFVRP